MISFDIEKGHFNLRAVAVIIRNGAVLVHRAESDDFWALPGGRVELFESTPETLIREMHEEINCAVRVERLLWIAENFFMWDEITFHEIGFYHLVALQDPILEKVLQPTFEGWENSPEVRLVFHWLPLTELHSARLYPTFLRAGLQYLPESTVHIIHQDSEE